MILHNIYVIHSDGICPLSIRLGSIDAEPEMVAGVFTASQKFWKHLTGEEPRYINFQNLKAHVRRFTTGEKTWYLLVIFEVENPKLLQTIEETIIQTVMNNRNLFEKFVADTNEISTSVQQQIIEKLRSIPCPYMHRKVFEFTCQVNSNKFKTKRCNIIDTLACKDKIKEGTQPRNSMPLLNLTKASGALKLAEF